VARGPAQWTGYSCPNRIRLIRSDRSLAMPLSSQANASDEALHQMRQRIGVAVQPCDTLLPMAATCSFQITLPPYTSKEALRDRLTYAIYNCKSMELC